MDKMTRQTPYLNEIVSLTVMLLMVMALVAGQADATVQEHLEANTVAILDGEPARFRTTIKAHFDGEPLTISIDATAEFDYFRLEDE